MLLLNAVNDQNPRQIAWEVLQQRRAGGSFTEDLLERALAKTGLSAVDRALCQELVYGVVRWQAALDWLIGRKTDEREQNPASKTCSGSACTRFSGSTGFPTTRQCMKPSNSPNATDSVRKPVS